MQLGESSIKLEVSQDEMDMLHCDDSRNTSHETRELQNQNQQLAHLKQKATSQSTVQAGESLQPVATSTPSTPTWLH